MNILSVFKKYTVDFVESIDELFDLQQRQNTYFVFDKKVYEIYKGILPKFTEGQLSLIEAAESHKTIDAALAICEKMTAFDSKRNTVLVSIGGGIIQDITGFVANTLYRGIPWLYFPTTLLAACDSCIGGKSSLNYKTYKNLLGSFYPPDRIMIYPQFFDSLSLTDYCSGLGEVVKFNIIAGQAGLTGIASEIDALLARDTKTLRTFVEKSLDFKRSFIEEDEFDKGKRILLNYAHTFGHAFETTSSYAIPHGIAVVLGLITANAVSLRRGILNHNTTSSIECICKKIIPIELKKEWFEINAVVAAVKKDKKQTSSSISAILLHDNYGLELYNDITVNEIDLAVQYMLQAVSP
jgi:3-dehydroquinate synthase